MTRPAPTRRTSPPHQQSPWQAPYLRSEGNCLLPLPLLSGTSRVVSVFFVSRRAAGGSGADGARVPILTVLPEVLTRTRERVTGFFRFGSGPSPQSGNPLTTPLIHLCFD